MTDTKLILETLLSYYTNTQHSPKAERLIDAICARETGDYVIILTGDDNDVSRLKEISLNAIPALDDRLYLHLIGIDTPLVPDNAAMRALLTAAVDEINKLERRVERLKKKLDEYEGEAGAESEQPCVLEQVVSEQTAHPVESRD